MAVALTGLIFTACSDDDGPAAPGDTNEYYIDATTSGQWNYFSFAKGELVGTGMENDADNAAWFARSDWDIAINRYNIRTNGGEATTVNSKGGVYTYDDAANAASIFSSILNVPNGISFDADKAITSSGMGGTTTVVRSEATVILFKKNEDGSSIMPPVYLQAPAYIFRSASGSSYYKVLFEYYQNATGVSGHVTFKAAQIYQ